MSAKNRKSPRKRRPSYAAKVGQAPGTPIHLGEIKTPAPSVSLFAYGPEGCEEHRFASIEASRDFNPNGRALWLNVYGLQQAEVMSEIGARFKLHPLSIEDILNTHQRPKIDDYGNYLFIVMRAWRLVPESAELCSDQISMVLGKNFVLCFQEQPGGLFEPIRERLRQGAGMLRSCGPDHLAYSMIDAVVDRYFTVLEQLGNSLDEIDDHLAQASPSDIISRLNLLKRDLRDLRHSIWPLREVLVTMQHQDQSLISTSTQLYLRDAHDHVVQVVEMLDSGRETASDLLDLHLSLESQRLNTEVRRLTALSMLFMPATLVSGVFGMNFQTMPWLQRADGFWLALGLMLSAALSLALVFWRRKLPSL